MLSISRRPNDVPDDLTLNTIAVFCVSPCTGEFLSINAGRFEVILRPATITECGLYPAMHMSSSPTGATKDDSRLTGHRPFPNNIEDSG